jgi:hypothetical protein
MARRAGWAPRPELGALAGLFLYGTASARDRAAVERLGAAIDLPVCALTGQSVHSTAWTGEAASEVHVVIERSRIGNV